MIWSAREGTSVVPPTDSSSRVAMDNNLKNIRNLPVPAGSRRHECFLRVWVDRRFTPEVIHAIFSLNVDISFAGAPTRQSGLMNASVQFEAVGCCCCCFCSIVIWYDGPSMSMYRDSRLEAYLRGFGFLGVLHPIGAFLSHLVQCTTYAQVSQQQ